MINEGDAVHASVESVEDAQEVAMNYEAMRAFVARNTFRIGNGPITARCIDGRYRSEDAMRAPLSVPGADPGYALVVFAALRSLGLDINPGTVWDAVVNAGGGEANFQFHTDSHAEHGSKGAARGCGHLRLAAANPCAYEVSADEIGFVFEMLEKLTERNPDRQIVLEGNHLETAVLVVRSKTHGIVPMEPAIAEGGRPAQVFVFQKTLHGQRMALLCSLLIQIPEVFSSVNQETLLQALEAAFAKQLGATLKTLASGDPLYEVEI